MLHTLVLRPGHACIEGDVLLAASRPNALEASSVTTVAEQRQDQSHRFINMMHRSRLVTVSGDKDSLESPLS